MRTPEGRGRDREKRPVIRLEQRSTDLTQYCCWGNFWLFRLFHRRNAGHEVNILQLGDLGLVDNLVTKIKGNVYRDVDVWKPKSVNCEPEAPHRTITYMK